MASVPVEVFFEFASTYSYPAVMRVEAAAAAAGVPMRWRPFLLGPVFAAHGWNDSPFNIYPLKGRYMWRDLARVCAKHGIDLCRPSRFPRPSLVAARVACLGAEAPWQGDFVRAVYRANFVDDREIGEPLVVAEILDGLGLDGGALVARTQDTTAKDALRRQTERAQALGVFGAPTFVVGEELFWGNDRLEDALDWAAERRPGARDGTKLP